MSDVEAIENVDGRGSMYGVVDSMRQLTRAFEELLKFLPADFMWPTLVNISPFSISVEWGRDATTEPRSEPGVWLVANAEGVRMNADFREGWPDVEALEFDAQIAAEWLQALTRNWKWGATRSGSTLSAHMQRVHM